MKVILTRDVPSLGRAGDVREVSDGHARNFLLPKRLALPATTEALERLQKEEQEKQAKIARESERLQAIKKKLEGKVFTIRSKASGKNLFAAIRDRDIASAIVSAGLEINPEVFGQIPPIKTVGTHEVEIMLNQTLSTKVKINVEPNDS